MISRRSLLASCAAAPVLATVSTAAAQEATPVPSTTVSGVVFAAPEGKDLHLNVRIPSKRGTPRPAVILIHGGGLISGGLYDLVSLERPLADAGYVTFNIEYRLYLFVNGTNRWPVQLDDVQTAIRWVRANAATYGVDPERIGVLGVSSGGQLASFLAVRDTRADDDPALAGISSRATCAVTIAGDMGLVPYPMASDNELTAELLGGTIEEVPDAYADYSPITFVDETSAPFLVLHGAADNVVPISHSDGLVEALRAADAEVTYGVYPRVGHELCFDQARILPPALAFFERHLRPDA